MSIAFNAPAMLQLHFSMLYICVLFYYTVNWSIFASCCFC